jgi:hypothetical protein
MNRNALFYALACVAVVMSLMVGDYGTLLVVAIFALLWKRA